MNQQRRPNAVRKPSQPFSCRRGIGAGMCYYAVDIEMVTIEGPDDLPARRAMVAAGVVNERLETLLYARVAVPRGCKVTDGVFARMQGGLLATWEEGIPASCVSDFLRRHVEEGGVVVGWELHNDLDVLGFERAASEIRNGKREALPTERAPIDSGSSLSFETWPGNGSSSSSSSTAHSRAVESPDAATVVGRRRMRVVEVTDLFRTMNGLKCTLQEAYAHCFDRMEEGAHNAATDARMTMELFNLWRRTGEPPEPLGLPLSFFLVNFHSFKPSRSRQASLGMLRPDGGGAGGLGRGIHGALEQDSGSNTYKLKFRFQEGREAYLHCLERKMLSAGLAWEAAPEFVCGKKGARDGYQLSCGSFKMHVLERDR
ncbi:unnamed protein product [Ectocarpus fasciculatus]